MLAQHIVILNLMHFKQQPNNDNNLSSNSQT